MSKEVKVCK